MAEALLSGLLQAKWANPKNLAVVEKLAERRTVLSGIFPKVQVLDEALAETDVLLAVKPNDAQSVCEILRSLRIERMLSIAAGVKTSQLEVWLDGNTRVIRVMPNTPALVGKAASVISPGSRVEAADLDWAKSILSSVGTVTQLEETFLDAVTGLSGSGPAYLFYLAEALIQAGQEAGLSQEVANQLTRQTLLGSAQMLAGSESSPQELRQSVTSPKGTTEAAINVLDEAQVRQAFLKAVDQAVRRSRELGQ